MIIYESTISVLSIFNFRVENLKDIHLLFSDADSSRSTKEHKSYKEYDNIKVLQL